MGVVGQAQSLAGLAAAYSLPPSSLPRTPNHEHNVGHLEFGPPRTPQHEGTTHVSSSSLALAAEVHGGHASHYGVGGAGSSLGGGQLGLMGHTGKLQTTHNYSGGQYAKYGKRY